MFLLPYRDTLLQRVDRVRGGRERGGPVRRRHDDQHRRLGELEIADPVQECHAARRRATGAEPRARSRASRARPARRTPRMSSRRHLTTLGVVAHDAAERDDRPRRGHGGPLHDGLRRQWLRRSSATQSAASVMGRSTARESTERSSSGRLPAVFSGSSRRYTRATMPVGERPGDDPRDDPHDDPRRGRIPTRAGPDIRRAAGSPRPPVGPSHRARRDPDAGRCHCRFRATRGHRPATHRDLVACSGRGRSRRRARDRRRAGSDGHARPRLVHRRPRQRDHGDDERRPRRTRRSRSPVWVHRWSPSPYTTRAARAAAPVSAFATAAAC